MSFSTMYCIECLQIIFRHFCRCVPEVPLVLYLFLLVSLVWLWAGLHMGYKHMWMLVLYIISNCLLVSSLAYFHNICLAVHLFIQIL